MSTPIAGTRLVPLQTRSAPITKADAADRMIQVIWTTGAAVQRKALPSIGISENYDEVLLVTDAAVDLSRLRNGAPVLDNHQTDTVGAQRAVVEDAWLQVGKGYATIRFPKAGIDLASDRLLGLAQDGIIRNISVGYSIRRYHIVEPTKAYNRLRLVADYWTPYELSFVLVPADIGAQVLTGTKRLSPTQLIGRYERASTIACAATKLRMELRADPRAAKIAVARYASYLRSKGIDPSGADVRAEQLQSLKKIESEALQRAHGSSRQIVR